MLREEITARSSSCAVTAESRSALTTAISALGVVISADVRQDAWIAKTHLWSCTDNNEKLRHSVDNLTDVQKSTTHV